MTQVGERRHKSLKKIDDEASLLPMDPCRRETENVPLTKTESGKCQKIGMW